MTETPSLLPFTVDFRSSLLPQIPRVVTVQSLVLINSIQVSINFYNVGMFYTMNGCLGKSETRSDNRRC